MDATNTRARNRAIIFDLPVPAEKDHTRFLSVTVISVHKRFVLRIEILGGFRQRFIAASFLRDVNVENRGSDCRAIMLY